MVRPQTSTIGPREQWKPDERKGLVGSIPKKNPPLPEDTPMQKRELFHWAPEMCVSESTHAHTIPAQAKSPSQNDLLRRR